jgi:hypothetical protein
MTTAPAYTDCPTCGIEVGIAIAFQHEHGPGVNARSPLVNESEIVDLQCDHRADITLWLESPAGCLWQSAQLEGYAPQRED